MPTTRIAAMHHADSLLGGRLTVLALALALARGHALAYTPMRQRCGCEVGSPLTRAGEVVQERIHATGEPAGDDAELAAVQAIHRLLAQCLSLSLPLAAFGLLLA